MSWHSPDTAVTLDTITSAFWNTNGRDNELFLFAARKQPGEFTFYGHDGVPSGHLDCDGSSFDPSTYADLYDAIGIEWGGTSSAPLLPALAGKFLLAVSNDYAFASTGGEATHTLTVAELPSHSHKVPWGNAGSSGNAAATVAPTSTIDTQNTGGGGAHQNMPPYAAVRVAIKT